MIPAQMGTKTKKKKPSGLISGPESPDAQISRGDYHYGTSYDQNSQKSLKSIQNVRKRLGMPPKHSKSARKPSVR